MFRAVIGHAQLRAFFELRVGYNGPIINRHGIELFLIDPDCTILKSWSRLQWQVQNVVGAVTTQRRQYAEILQTSTELG